MLKFGGCGKTAFVSVMSSQQSENFGSGGAKDNTEAAAAASNSFHRAGSRLPPTPLLTAPFRKTNMETRILWGCFLCAPPGLVSSCGFEARAIVTALGYRGKTWM